MGAVDFISKPINPVIVRARVRTHLSLVRVEELRETRLQIVQGLEIDDFSRGKIDASVAELQDEAKAVAELGLI